MEQQGGMDEIDSRRFARPNRKMQVLLPPPMKKEVKNLLKEKGKSDFFTEDRFEIVKELMKISMKNSLPLKTYLSFDPLNKAQYVADHIIKLVEANQI